MTESWEEKIENPNMVVGITTQDFVRANKFVDEVTGADIEGINIPIIGSHVGSTMLPLFSHDAAVATFPQNQILDVDRKVQDVGSVVVIAKKKGKGSVTFSMVNVVLSLVPEFWLG